MEGGGFRPDLCACAVSPPAQAVTPEALGIEEEVLAGVAEMTFYRTEVRVRCLRRKGLVLGQVVELF